MPKIWLVLAKGSSTFPHAPKGQEADSVAHQVEANEDGKNGPHSHVKAPVVEHSLAGSHAGCAGASWQFLHQMYDSSPGSASAAYRCRLQPTFNGTISHGCQGSKTETVTLQQQGRANRSTAKGDGLR